MARHIDLLTYLLGLFEMRNGLYFLHESANRILPKGSILIRSARTLQDLQDPPMQVRRRKEKSGGPCTEFTQSARFRDHGFPNFDLLI